MFDLNKILRHNIRDLVPYSSARHEFTGEASVFLDANENSYGTPLKKNYNRYPDPLQMKLKEKISKIQGIPLKNIFLGNGSDEAIDILFRAFCIPGKDQVILCPPTYGMYEVSAHINDVQICKVELNDEFQPDPKKIMEMVKSNTKLIFLCSPNNPSGNALHLEAIEYLLAHFEGIILIDEAYIQFSTHQSFTRVLDRFPNLVILQTLSKAWGMAGLRIGLAFASEEIIQVFNKVKPPYNLSQASIELALEALENKAQADAWISEIISERKKLMDSFMKFSFVLKVFPSDANFLLVKTSNPRSVYNYLASKGIIVRDRSNIPLCEGCLRITVGTKEQNKQLIEAFENYKA